jgi:hypothetical protein
MKCIRFGILVLACVFIFCNPADAKAISETDKAKKVFVSFFQAMGKPYNSGLPDQNLQKELQPYFSIEFAKIVKEAESRESECIRIYSKYNEEIENKTPRGKAPATLKPPLVESSIFASQNESPDSFKIVSATSKNKKIILTINYTAYDRGTAANFTWKNKVLLTHENGLWKIDDFIDMEDQSNKPEDENAYVKSFLKSFPSCKNDFNTL